MHGVNKLETISLSLDLKKNIEMLFKGTIALSNVITAN